MNLRELVKAYQDEHLRTVEEWMRKEGVETFLHPYSGCYYWIAKSYDKNVISWTGEIRTRFFAAMIDNVIIYAMPNTRHDFIRFDSRTEAIEALEKVLINTKRINP